MVPTPTAYVDMAGLSSLRARAAQDQAGAIGEAAIQFEAMMIAMMMKSARKASLGEGLFDSNQTDQYLEMMDQQVSLELARSGGLGFADTIVEQFGFEDDVAASEAPNLPPLPPLPPRDRPVSSPEDFVRRYSAAARDAARELGVDHRLLLAQAALETGWGQAAPELANGQSAHNLFGIKAGASWQGPRVSKWTLEYSGGVAERRREQFRVYGSAAESFADYVGLLTHNDRYAGALSVADNPEAFAKELSAAGYATDPDYADKWLAIYNSEWLTTETLALK